MGAFIDDKFRKKGEEFFGKEVMDEVTDEQVELTRYEAMNELRMVTIKYGKQDPNAVYEIFCNLLWGWCL